MILKIRKNQIKNYFEKDFLKSCHDWDMIKKTLLYFSSFTLFLVIKYILLKNYSKKTIIIKKENN